MKLRNKLTITASLLLLIVSLLHSFKYKYSTTLFTEGFLAKAELILFTVNLILIITALIIAVLYILRQQWNNAKFHTYIAANSIFILLITAAINSLFIL